MVEALTATITIKEDDDFSLEHRSPTESNYLYARLSNTIGYKMKEIRVSKN